MHKNLNCSNVWKLEKKKMYEIWPGKNCCCGLWGRNLCGYEKLIDRLYLSFVGERPEVMDGSQSSQGKERKVFYCRFSFVAPNNYLYLVRWPEEWGKRTPRTWGSSVMGPGRGENAITVIRVSLPCQAGSPRSGEVTCALATSYHYIMWSFVSITFLHAWLGFSCLFLFFYVFFL